MATPDQLRPDEVSRDLNVSPLPMFVRVLRAVGFGIIGMFILSAMFLGADSMLAKSQFILGIGGSSLAAMAMRFSEWCKAASPVSRFLLFSFLGALLGTVIATAVFGGWSLSDAIAAGLGAGLINGILITLGAVALRTAALSFSK